MAVFIDEDLPVRYTSLKLRIFNYRNMGFDYKKYIFYVWVKMWKQKDLILKT